MRYTGQLHRYLSRHLDNPYFLRRYYCSNRGRRGFSIVWDAGYCLDSIAEYVE